MRTRFGVLGHQEEKLCKEATLRAIAAGNVLSAESGGYDIFDPAAANAHMKANKALGQKLVAEVGARLGELDRDWGYSIMTSTKPDGIGRLNVVYYTRLDEPAKPAMPWRASVANSRPHIASSSRGCRAVRHQPAATWA